MTRPATTGARPGDQELDSVRALLFDLGGVIIDIDPQACFAHWAQAAGVGAERIAQRWLVDDAYKAFEVGAIDFPEYLRSLSSRIGITLSEAQWRAGWNALLLDLFHDVVAALPKAAGRLPLYCFSNTNIEHQAVWERRFASALAPFRKVYTSWEIGHRKPDVESFLHVASDIGVPPADILFLDDSPANVAGAIAAGLRARHVTGPGTTLAVLDEIAGHPRAGKSATPEPAR